MVETFSRRPIRARDTRWAARIAAFLARHKILPNTISLLSVFFAALAAAALFLAAAPPCPTARIPLLIAAAAGIQLRLLCNLFDGMVAIEGGFKSKSGELYNEFPDRISDVLVLVAAGCFAGGAGPMLGTAAAMLALLTAYVRSLAGSAGATPPFCGPMAKQQRMALITCACLLSTVEPRFTAGHPVMLVTLAVIIVGAVITTIRRLKLTAAELERS